MYNRMPPLKPPADPTKLNFHFVPAKKPHATELGIQQMIATFSRENELAITPENTQIFRDGIEREHDGVWNVENLRAVMRQHSTEFVREPKKLRVIPRLVTPEEVMAMAQQVMAANPWIDSSSEKNGELIATTFLDDPRISPKRNLADMVKAFEICKDKLDRTPPPPPPAPPQYEEPKPLESWQLPYPQADWQLHRASREQVADYVARLRKRELWMRENPQ